MSKNLSRKLLKHADARGDFIEHIHDGGAHVVFTLQVEPEARIHFEKQSEAQRGISGDGASAIDQFADAAGGNVDVGRELARGDAHRFHKVFQQDFAGVGFCEFFAHFLASLSRA